MPDLYSDCTGTVKTVSVQTVFSAVAGMGFQCVYILKSENFENIIFKFFIHYKHIICVAENKVYRF
jgi:hypothetical protein